MKVFTEVQMKRTMSDGKTIAIALKPMPLQYPMEWVLGCDVTKYPFEFIITTMDTENGDDIVNMLFSNQARKILSRGIMYMVDDDYDAFKADPLKMFAKQGLIPEEYLEGVDLSDDEDEPSEEDDND